MRFSFLSVCALALGGLLRYRAEPGAPGAWLVSVLAAGAVFAVAAAAEEVLYRGYAFQALVRGMGRWPAVLITSVWFALAHGQNPAVGRLALFNINDSPMNATKQRMVEDSVPEWQSYLESVIEPTLLRWVRSAASSTPRSTSSSGARPRRTMPLRTSWESAKKSPSSVTS